jgi:soluble lytic murein transglycosylase
MVGVWAMLWMVAASADGPEPVRLARADCQVPARSVLDRICSGAPTSTLVGTRLATSPAALLWLVDRGVAVSTLAEWIGALPKRARTRTATAKLWAELARDVESARIVLVNDYNETEPALTALATNPSWANHVDRSRDATIARAERFEATQNHEGVVVTLAGLEKDCDANLLLGKTARKQRNHGLAANLFANAMASSCAAATQRKAHYAAVKLMHQRRQGGLAAGVDSFLSRVGDDDPLADDVLFWRAQAAASKGRAVEARRDFDRLLAAQPNGDMAAEAVFAAAMSLLREGKSAAARTALVAERDRPGRTSKPDDDDRLRYWSARLSLAAQPTSAPALPRCPAGEACLSAAQQQAITEMTTLAKRPTWYGALAQSWLVGAADTFTKTAPLRSPVPPGERMGAMDAAIDEARTLVAAGAMDHAGFVLETIELPARDARAFDIAALHLVRNDPAAAHQVLRDVGLALLPNTLDGTDNQAQRAYSLAWPRAFATELDSASSEAKLPAGLLMAIAREESTFDAGVMSWAGAYGLCQLMPPTADEEAKALGIELHGNADLLQPAINARLGAAHLARRLRGLGASPLAIAAYNAGPGAVAKWLPADKTAVALDWWVENIPVDETRNYVKKVTGSWLTYAWLDGGDAPVLPLTVKRWRS